MNIQGFLNAVLKQDAEQLRTYFSDSAYINWYCTNEHLSVKLFCDRVLRIVQTIARCTEVLITQLLFFLQKAVFQMSDFPAY